MITRVCLDNEHEWEQADNGVWFCEVCGIEQDREGDHDSEVTPNGQL